MCDPAKQIIDRCGGVAAVAEWLGLNRTSVLRWTHPRAKGGTGGLVPTKHQFDLLSKAKANGVKLRPADFFAQPANDTSDPADDADPRQRAA